jgi:D-sedoheptulose 7-phosphate isomerase
MSSPHKRFPELVDVFESIIVTDQAGSVLDFNATVESVIKRLLAVGGNGGKIMMIGNGGSASIASHITTDFIRNASLPAITFMDSSLMTCLSNDMGYACVFEKPVEMLAGKHDVLFSISSSGASQNIIRAVKMARKKGTFLITLSGFETGNPLRSHGDINFYAPSRDYGSVEIAHLAICHHIVDKIKLS